MKLNLLGNNGAIPTASQKMQLRVRFSSILVSVYALSRLGVFLFSGLYPHSAEIITTVIVITGLSLFFAKTGNYNVSRFLTSISLPAFLLAESVLAPETLAQNLNVFTSVFTLLTFAGTTGLLFKVSIKNFSFSTTLVLGLLMIFASFKLCSTEITDTSQLFSLNILIILKLAWQALVLAVLLEMGKLLYEEKREELYKSLQEAKRLSKELERTSTILEDRNKAYKDKKREERLKRRELTDVHARMEVLRREHERVKKERKSLLELKEELEVQAEQVSEVMQEALRQADSVHDSIRYAQTIQQAILPKEDLLNSFTEDHMVVYRPKDLVSGDLYWAFFDGKSAMTAVIDCTGHGVPGAFMSIIAHTLLEDIVNNKGVRSPSGVLELMNLGVRRILHQDEHRNTDGMDMVLCLFEPTDTADKVKMSFAGAKRPVLCLEPGAESFTEIKGTRKSLGYQHGKSAHRSFKEVSRIFDIDTRFIMFTDGITDAQAKDRSKFGKKHFEDFLLETRNQTGAETERLLLKTLLEEQSDSNQRDDISILGVKIKPFVH